MKGLAPFVHIKTGDFMWPFGIGAAVAFLLAIAGAVGWIDRYRRGDSQRKALRALIRAGLVAGVVFLILWWLTTQ